MAREEREARLPGNVVRYLAVVSLAGSAAIAWGAWTSAPFLRADVPVIGIGVLFIGCFLAQVMPPRLMQPGQRVAIHPDEAFVLLAFAVMPAPFVVLASSLAILCAQLVRRNKLVKVAFNLSVYSISTTASALFLAGLTARHVPLEYAVLIVPLVMSSVNHTLMSLLLARLQAVSAFEVLHRDLIASVMLTSLVGTLGGYVGLTLLQVHPVALLGLVPLGYVAYRITLMGYHHENELRTRRVLNRVSETLMGTATEDAVVREALGACVEVFSPHRAEVTLHAADGAPERSWTHDGDAPGNLRTMRVSAPVLSASGDVIGELAIVLPWLPRHQVKLDRDLLTLVARFLGLMLAVTSSVKSVHESEERFRSILNGVSAPIVVVNARGNVVYQNGAVTQMLRERGQTERLELDVVLGLLEDASAARFKRALEEPLDAAIPFFEVESRGEGDEKRHFEVNVSPVRLKGGEDGRIIVCHEITMRRRLEREAEARREAAARSERLASLGILVAGVAHEINNPLMYMVGNLDLALMDLDALQADLADAGIEVDADGFTEMQRRLHTVKEGSERIGRISKALKVVSRNDANATHRPVSVTDVLSSVRDLVNLGVPKNVHLTFDVPEGPVIVQGNASELHQVFLNLVQNALEALDGNEGRVHVTCTTRARDAVVVVTDDGPGIPPDVQARLFTPFYTTKAEGTGLGLSLAHTFIKDHDGELTLESGAGQGTRFTVRVPLAADDATADAAALPPRAGGLRLNSTLPPSAG